MVGTSVTSKAGKASFEMWRVAPSAAGVSFFAQPGGQPPTEFAMKEIGPQRIVFENKKHDFPQRIIYWRDESGLAARIEGTMNGKEEGRDWRYKAAPLNARCPGLGDRP
jgi:hypothetical protein